MKKDLITLLLISCITVSSAVTYTLDALLEIGFQNSREIKLVEDEMSKADAQVKECYGKALPTIDFGAKYQYAPEQFSPLGIGGGSGGSVADILQETGIGMSSEPGSYILAGVLDGMKANLSPKDHQANIGLTLTQPIYAQGKIMTGLKIAKLYDRSLLCKLQDAQMNVKAKITKQFYAALLVKKNITIQQEAIDLAAETHRLAVIRLQSGSGTELDTLNSRLNLENTRISLQEAEKSLRMSLEVLIKTTGIPEQVNTMELEGDFPVDDYAIPLEKAIELVQSENKQVILLNVAREIQKHVVKLAKSDYLPTVYGGASISKITQFAPDDKVVWQDDRRVFLGVSCRLFDGMQSAFRITQAKAQERMIIQGREMAVEGLEIATRNAWEQLETSREKLKQAEFCVTLAEKAYGISKRAYELGSITLLDFRDSEQKLNGARLAYNAAQFGFHSAIVDMRLLTADYLFDKANE